MYRKIIAAASAAALALTGLTLSSCGPHGDSNSPAPTVAARATTLSAQHAHAHAHAHAAHVDRTFALYRGPKGTHRHFLVASVCKSYVFTDHMRIIEGHGCGRLVFPQSKRITFTADTHSIKTTHTPEHSCLAQMHSLTHVSREAGITIGSAFTTSVGFHPTLWHRQLAGQGLRTPARAALLLASASIGIDQAFVRAMTDAAARIIDNSPLSHCSGGLPRR